MVRMGTQIAFGRDFGQYWDDIEAERTWGRWFSALKSFSASGDGGSFALEHDVCVCVCVL